MTEARVNIFQLWVDNMNRRAGSKVWSIGSAITADNQVIDYRNMKCWESCFRQFRHCCHFRY